MFNKIMSKQMNILLWVLQILLALWNMIGGIYMVNNYEKLANVWALNALPKPAWIALGVLQALFALGLVLPGALRVLPKLTSISAACLAVISLLGMALYVQYTGFPGILWAVVPAILAAFVAYWRWPTRNSA
jgi:hypothetical protein